MTTLERRLQALESRYPPVRPPLPGLTALVGPEGAIVACASCPPLPSGAALGDLYAALYWRERAKCPDADACQHADSCEADGHLS